MNKKNNLALYTLFIVGLFSLFTSNIFAQKTESAKSEQPLSKCSSEKFVMPTSISIDNEAFSTFINVMSFPDGKRQKRFSELSNEDKANVFKVNIALNFIKRPNLTKEQKDLILDSIVMISADTYSKESPELIERNQKQAEILQQKALAIFPPTEAYEIFASLNGDKNAEIELLQKYKETLTLPLSERKKLILETTPAEKSNFWKSQMIYHIATGKFSNAQKLFIANLFPKMTANSFNFPVIEGQVKNEETKSLEAVTSNGIEIFSKEEFFTIFMGYGIHKQVNEKPSKELNNLVRMCDCNYVCGWGQTCTSTSCGISTSGCGVFGGSECSSYCLNN